jgi:hypothetical protein
MRGPTGHARGRRLRFHLLGAHRPPFHRVAVAPRGNLQIGSPSIAAVISCGHPEDEERFGHDIPVLVSAGRDDDRSDCGESHCLMIGTVAYEAPVS